MKTLNLFCFGLGYCAQHLATKLLPVGWQISGTHRSVVLDRNSDSAIQLYEFEQLTQLPKDITHLLISIPPRGNTDMVIKMFAEQINALKRLQWVGYLSATSVYGDHQGEWVTESTPASPEISPLARPRVMAEQQWLNLWHNHSVPIHIFRLAGIYGPGRSEIEKALAKQSRIIRKNNHVFSRIHVEDIAEALLASLAKPNPGEIFNLADDLPTAHATAVEYACQLLGIPAPAPEDYDTAVMSEMLRYFYSKSARVSNKKAKEVLGWQLRYPTYKEGLTAIYNLRHQILPKP